MVIYEERKERKNHMKHIHPGLREGNLFHFNFFLFHIIIFLHLFLSFFFFFKNLFISSFFSLKVIFFKINKWKSKIKRKRVVCLESALQYSYKISVSLSPGSEAETREVPRCHALPCVHGHVDQYSLHSLWPSSLLLRVRGLRRKVPALPISNPTRPTDISTHMPHRNVTLVWREGELPELLQYLMTFL